MATGEQKVNNLTTGVPQITDYVTTYDSAGTCKKSKLSDLQEVITPPNYGLKEF